MLYLKNTLGGWGRSLTDTALHTFRGPHRWWRLALYAVMFVLPGGSLGVLFFAWIDHRRGRRDAQSGHGAGMRQLPLLPASASAAGKDATSAGSLVPGSTICQARGNAPVCRAAAGKVARQGPTERV
ncbi:hypothetical protein [Paraburkholderia flava]|uniref:hypothetical protein n=1 Tax=Paraburkholderia flava TaxID=2547393 RepID=UPI00105F4785|nr:hypothetical protein [Paraburkholderia flava]